MVKGYHTCLWSLHERRSNNAQASWVRFPALTLLLFLYLFNTFLTVYASLGAFCDLARSIWTPFGEITALPSMAAQTGKVELVLS